MKRNRTNSYHLPKGTPEHGESLSDTVLREVQEETGYRIALGPYLRSVFSEFESNGVIVKKETHYYLARCSGGNASKHDQEHDEVFFTDLKKAIRLFREKRARFGREDELRVLEKAREVLTCSPYQL